MWALATSNKYLKEHEQFKKRRKHLKAVRLSRGAVNQSCPKMPQFLNDRPKQRVIKELENEKVWYENQVLLNKLTKIDKKKGRLNPYKLINQYWRPSLTHFDVLNNRANRKVKRENQALMKRIKSAKSLYRVKKYKKHGKKVDHLKQRISRNARRIGFSRKEKRAKRKLLSKKSARASYQILQTNPSGKNFKNFYDSTDLYDGLEFRSMSTRAKTANVNNRLSSVKKRRKASLHPQNDHDLANSLNEDTPALDGEDF